MTSLAEAAPVASDNTKDNDEGNWKPEYTPEWIEWYDHSSYSESVWRTIEEFEALGPIRVVSLGFVITENDKSLVIVPHYGENDKGGGEMCILKTDIVVRRPLEVETD